MTGIGPTFFARMDPHATYFTMTLLFLAIGVALAFEFVNGFHDTANAVATVIYTHTLKPTPAVVWSGLCNLLGFLFIRYTPQESGSPEFEYSQSFLCFLCGHKVSAVLPHATKHTYQQSRPDPDCSETNQFLHSHRA